MSLFLFSVICRNAFYRGCSGKSSFLFDIFYEIGRLRHRGERQQPDYGVAKWIGRAAAAAAPSTKNNNL